jgi:hypothetical protein
MQDVFAFLLLLRRALAAGLCVMVAACAGGDSGDNGTGVLSLGVTDAPVDEARSVVVQFSGVAFKHEGMGPETVMNMEPSPRQIDLLQTQNGNAAILLNNVTLPAGRYQWLRLIVEDEPNVRDSFLVLNSGAECELIVPSGAESGLKLNGGFTLPAGGSAALTVHFNLHDSIQAPPGQTGSGLNCTEAFLMRPTLHLVDNANVGAIGGHVDAALVTADCIPNVYVFEGENAVVDDMEESTTTTPDVDPTRLAKVNVVNGASQYQYLEGFVPTGAYTVAFTCGADDPVVDDTLTFFAPQNVTVQNNLITTVDFVAPAPGG